MEKEIESKMSFLLTQINKDSTPDSVMKLTQGVTNLMNALCNYRVTQNNIKK